MPNLLKVRLSLKGRPIRTYTFNKKAISIGRDPGSDIFLDNTGISRNHAQIERSPGGYVIEDLGSANGTFLNTKAVKRDFVGHDDVIQIGKFSLWMGVESDRRDGSLLPQTNPGVFEGTTVLSPDQLEAMQLKAQSDDDEPVSSAFSSTVPATSVSRGTWLGGLLASFLIGITVGVVVAMQWMG
jgi:pSer/pThr/pTyr-binding forkhead associated (FHA) protein